MLKIVGYIDACANPPPPTIALPDDVDEPPKKRLRSACKLRGFLDAEKNNETICVFCQVYVCAGSN